MKLSTAFLFSVLTVSSSPRSTLVGASVFDMHLKSVGYVRTDPILDNQCLSGHVHAFYGTKSLWPSTTYEDLIAVDPYEVSGNIEENKSLYWHPAVYKVLNDGTHELQETELGVYYIWDAKDPSVRAFPPGFAMIAGGSKLNSKAALNFECDGNNNFSSNSFPTQACNGEFFIEFKMPNCWNGQDRDANDSHVTYSIEGGNENVDSCPNGYDKIPQLWLFIEFPNGYTGGQHVFSDGSEVLHVDYFNGWVESQLEAALRGCDNNDFNPSGGSKCDLFTYKNEVLNLGEDFRYSPAEEFPVNLITDEAITGILELPSGSAKNGDGTCAANDTPKAGGGEPTQAPAVPSPTEAPVTSPTEAPVTSPTQAPVPSPTQAPVTSPTQAPVPVVSVEECIETCWEAFDLCDLNVDDHCGDEAFLEPCEEDCALEFEGEEELEDECFEEWCPEEQGQCYEDADKRCRRARRQCKRACELLV